MKTILFLLLLLPALVWGQEKPNIIVILSDDFGYGSAGCYGADPKLVRTPNLDRLAAEGRRFTDANTPSSVCSPTRYAVMTGRYCWRTTLTSGVLNTFAPLHIEPTRLNLASMLKKHGYNTAAIGKWHLGYGSAEKTDYTQELTPGPLDIGFDYHFGVPSNHGDMTGIYVENRAVYGLGSDQIPSADFKATYTKDDTESGKRDPMALQAPRRVNERVMPLLTQKAADWIKQQKAETPFFLYYTPVGVHNPITPDKDVAGTSAAGPYGDWIHELDRSVGGILKALDDKDLAKNTLVIFTSDNGGVTASGRLGTPQAQAEAAGLKINGALRGRKHNIWEGGFKVPFIVRWPDRAPAGTECDSMIGLVDILGTVAAVVGEPLPPASQGAEDTRSFLPFLMGKKQEPRPDLIVHSSDGVFALRQGPWKWIEGEPVEGLSADARKAHSDEFRPQLYHLADDPAETKDVRAANEARAKDLQALLARYRDGGYSRELPPLEAIRPPAAALLEPLTGKLLQDEKLAQLPAAWTTPLGQWTAQDGGLWGAQGKKDPTGATLRIPISARNMVIQYDLSFRGADRHTCVISTGGGKHSVRIEVSRGQLGVTKNPSAGEAKDQVLPLGSKPVKLKAEEWYSLRVTLNGTEATAEIAGVSVTGTHQVIGESKSAVNLKVFGSSMACRNFQAAALE